MCMLQVTLCHTPTALHPTSLTLTASTGKAPAAVSPLSMTQSVPSSTALATSVASARVGLGFLIMLSSIWVAVMTGLPAGVHKHTGVWCGNMHTCVVRTSVCECV